VFFSGLDTLGDPFGSYLLTSCGLKGVTQISFGNDKAKGNFSVFVCPSEGNLRLGYFRFVGHQFFPGWIRRFNQSDLLCSCPVLEFFLTSNGVVDVLVRSK